MNPMLTRATWLLAFLVVFPVISMADCPPDDMDRWLATIEVSPGDHLIAFPVTGDRVAHRGTLQACVYDSVTKEAISDMTFTLVPYSGTAPATGPRAEDLQYFNPSGTLETAGEVRTVATSESGEIVERNLLPGQYALAPDWDYVETDRISVDFLHVTTLNVDVAIGRAAGRDR